ncbi:MAG: hypothetical protein HFH68_15870, partial [Lachnospiraceae bacterium]|nr:hypothetical protein [Lachnospiraceae bacterium]
AVIDETRKTATFTSASKYAVGTYTVTATAGESKQSKDIVIEAQKAKDIIIKSTTALVNPDKKQEVFVYYDVVDQYGESMRSNTTITWTSGTGKVKSNKTTGCLTIAKADGDETEFKYGDDIYLVGVDIKNGISIQKALKVGMERALDKIDFIGFINTDDRNTILPTLPKDFALGKYRLLFTAYDQEGNPMNADKKYTDTKSPKVTFIADNPTLIKPEFKQGELYTINGYEYCSVTVEPGMYVDKGGEVNITAISNTTGNKSTKNFVIGDASRLHSLVLSVPDDIVADGDVNVNIPFVAKDVDGKEITNYETIVRSTNTLKLTATEGTLTVYETETGAAAVKWSDSISAGDFSTSSSHDGVNRNIALVSVVVGGESSNMMMEVSDTRRPVAISSVKLNDDNNNTVTESNNVTVGFFENNDVIAYMDQYNKPLDNWKANAFFWATNGSKDKDGNNNFDGHEYGVKVDYSTVQNISASAIGEGFTDSNLDADVHEKNIQLDTKTGSKAIIMQPKADKPGYSKLNINTQEIGAGSVMVDNLKYSVVRLEDDKKLEWGAVDADKNIDYTIVPVRKLSNLDIRSIAKLRIDTEFSKYANGSLIENASSSAIALREDGEGVATVDGVNAAKADWDKNRGVYVTGSYDGKVVTMPNGFYDNVGSKEINPTFVIEKDGTNGKIAGLVSYDNDYEGRDAIRYGDLYDFNTAKNTRKDVRKNLFVNVYDTSGKTNKENLIGTVKTSVTVSDEARGPVKIVFIDKGTVANKLSLNASDTNIIFDNKINKYRYSYDVWGWNTGILVTDQYGDGMVIKNPNDINDASDPAKVTVEYSVTNSVENTDEFAHLPKSFAPSKNGSELASVDGVEIKDKFDLTATVVETGVSVKVPVTIGADECANLNTSVYGDERSYRYEYGYCYNGNIITKEEYDAGIKTDAKSSYTIGYGKRYWNNEDGKYHTLRDTLGYDR